MYCTMLCSAALLCYQQNTCLPAQLWWMSNDQAYARTCMLSLHLHSAFINNTLLELDSACILNCLGLTCCPAHIANTTVKLNACRCRNTLAYMSFICTYLSLCTAHSNPCPSRLARPAQTSVDVFIYMFVPVMHDDETYLHAEPNKTRFMPGVAKMHKQQASHLRLKCLPARARANNGRIL